MTIPSTPRTRKYIDDIQSKAADGQAATVTSDDDLSIRKPSAFNLEDVQIENSADHRRRGNTAHRATSLQPSHRLEISCAPAPERR